MKVRKKPIGIQQNQGKANIKHISFRYIKWNIIQEMDDNFDSTEAYAWLKG